MPPVGRKKALILVRTYPTPAKNGVEVSCTAAITEDGKWLRLFPIPYRYLDQDKRFRKYQWIEVDTIKAKDARPESYKIDRDSINILTEPLSTDHNWRARKDLIYPLMAQSLCALKREQVANGHPTLGIFKPKTIEKLIIEPTDPNWTQGQLEILSQGDLFQSGPAEDLEKVPFKFSYKLLCDDDSCTGHTMICTDWEIGESWRKWSKEYGDNWEAKFRQRYETEMINRYDTHFYVGTVHQYPDSWIIVGLFYPPRAKALPLFDSEPPLEDTEF